MNYPNTPFTNKFDCQSLISINKTNNDNKDINLEKLLQWLCTWPKISSFRINLNKYSREYVIELLKNEIRKVVNDVDSLISNHPILNDVILVKCLPNQGKLIRLSLYKEIIVDPFCAAAILRGSHIFAPGVVAMESGIQKGEIVSVYVDVNKKCKKGAKKFDDHKIFVGNGEVKMVRYELFGENLQPSGVAIKMIETISRIPHIDESNFPEDCLLLQNLPSILCGHILKPEENDCILDMCAAPGNKTTHLGLLMKNQGTIVAIDKTETKVKQIRRSSDKFMLTNIHSFAFDSTKLNDDTGNQDVLIGPPFTDEVFDKILLDAPCSNLGKRPQFYNGISTKEASSYVSLQRNLFFNAVQLLKPGGHLLYSTCTVSLRENEGIVAWALDTFDFLELMPAEPVLGSPGWPGTGLTEEQQKLVQRFGPDDETDSVGFFIALFVKN